ncbi:hypothetical protein L1887_12352 [Cichorium endivia]|nr:hypothetical protein L1887_12352 [Cichorium endivia]
MKVVKLILTFLKVYNLCGTRFCEIWCAFLYVGCDPYHPFPINKNTHTRDGKIQRSEMGEEIWARSIGSSAGKIPKIETHIHTLDFVCVCLPVYTKIMDRSEGNRGGEREGQIET